MGVIEVDMFPEEVDGINHPDAETFKMVLEQVAEEYDSELITFEVDKGTVSFSFESDILTADILKILRIDDSDGDS